MHLGNARTALFNYLYARHCGGEFVLRIEDTDRTRHTEAAVQVIYDTLRWMGLDWDGPVLRQSERLPIYQSIAQRLIDEGKAYRCTCSREELECKKAAMKDKICHCCYDGTCRDKHLGPDCGPHVVRFRMPHEGISSFDDLVMGHIEKNFADLDDFIMVRTDGTPTYQFAVVVDDLALKISHVIRGSDHIDNTHDQLALYNALGQTPPRFAHAPRILGLSKRKGSPSVEYYRDALGLLPEGLNNYLARLGWSHGNDELFSMDELIRDFDVTAINPSNGNFDEEKLKWVNEQQLRMVSLDTLASHVIPLFESRAGIHVQRGHFLTDLLELMRERAHNLNEIVDQSLFMFKAPNAYDEKSMRKNFKPETPDLLDAFADALAKIDTWDDEHIDAAIQNIVASHNIKLGALAQPVRIALVGIAQSPGIHETIRFVGRDETIRRLHALSDFGRGLPR